MIKFVSVEYDLDELLTKSVVVSGHLIKVDDVLRGEKSVRRWYRSGYGHGRESADMPHGLSWIELFTRMRNGESIEKIIKTKDAFVRQRILCHLAELMAVPYDLVYNLWLNKNCKRV